MHLCEKKKLNVKNINNKKPIQKIYICWLEKEKTFVYVNTSYDGLLQFWIILIKIRLSKSSTKVVKGKAIVL